MKDTQKLKIGQAIVKDLDKRIKFSKSGEKSATLKEVLFEGKPYHGEGLDYFLHWSNPLFKKFSREAVLEILVEKKAIDETALKHYNALYQKIFEISAYKKKITLEDLKKFDEIKHLDELKQANKEEETTSEEIEKSTVKILERIHKKYISGRLKRALLTKTPEKGKKTTLARSVPLNHVYPEKTKKEVGEKGYKATDIKGLDQITVKQIEALLFLAEKAQNQTEEEKKVLKIWDEIAGESHRGFRVIAFKTSEYITQSQGKDSSLISSKDKLPCVQALDEIKDVAFTLRWEEKKGRDKKHLLAKHPLVKTLNPKHPWKLVENEKDKKRSKNFNL